MSAPGIQLSSQPYLTYFQPTIRQYLQSIKDAVVSNNLPAARQAFTQLSKAIPSPAQGNSGETHEFAVRISQGVQDLELAWCEPDRLAVGVRLHLFGIDAQRLGMDRRAAGRLAVQLGAPQMGIDARHELLHRERLGDVVVRAELESLHSIGVLHFRGEHDDRHTGACTELSTDLFTGQVGEHEIQDHQGRTFLLKDGERFDPARRGQRRVPGMAEVRADDFSDLRLIVDDEHAEGN